jgi:hypothetical protein
VSKIRATYIEYKGTHRAAHKVNKEKSTTVIDSSAKRVLKLQVGEKIEVQSRSSCWENNDRAFPCHTGEASAPTLISSYLSFRGPIFNLASHRAFRCIRYVLLFEQVWAVKVLHNDDSLNS